MGRRVMFVDDDEAMGAMMRPHLLKRGYEVSFFASGAAAFDAIRTDNVDVVVTDLNMRGMSGLELCERIVADRNDVPVIVITAFGSMETAIGAIRAGAYDFVPKPFDIDVLVVAIDRALQHRALKDEVVKLRRMVAESRAGDQLIGDSTALQRVRNMLSRIGDSDASVLISGESGTGKEVVARTLHERSRRREGPFIAINCAAVPEALLESELFGHIKGAFTDARTSRVGLFVQASGGTLFLDEIGELPLGLQPKLLRALQERKVRPLGADHEVPFDVRICAATNRNLEMAASEGKFREDLYFRLNVISIELPPLRARGNDILLLAHHFLSRYGQERVTGISPPAAAKLLAYPWPGNVRELGNCIERAVALAQYENIVVEDLPERIRDTQRPPVPIALQTPEEFLSMDEVERRYILRVLDATGGKKAAAAKILGFDRTTLYRKLERYGLGNQEG